MAVARVVAPLVAGVVLVLTPVGAQERGQAETTPGVRKDLRDGSYIVSYVLNGEPKEYRFTPATLTKPSIQSRVAFDAPANAFSYDYTLSNGQTAAQELHSIDLRVAAPAAVRSTPAGWETVSAAASGKILWYLRTTDGRRRGIVPGASQDGFRLESPNLPGPVEARAMGNVGPPSFPTDMPPALLQRLDHLIRTDYIVVNVLSPVVPRGDNEPELTPEVLVARIRGAYDSAILRSKHPRAVALSAALERLVGQVAGADQNGRRAAIQGLRGLTSGAGGDSWAQTLGAGLQLALDHVASRQWN